MTYTDLDAANARIATLEAAFRTAHADGVSAGVAYSAELVDSLSIFAHTRKEADEYAELAAKIRALDPAEVARSGG